MYCQGDMIVMLCLHLLTMHSDVPVGWSCDDVGDLVTGRDGDKIEGLQHLPLQAIKLATANFSEERVVGEGSFGRVYRGHGPDGEEWAVKRSKYRARNRQTEFAIEVGLDVMTVCDTEPESPCTS